MNLVKNKSLIETRKNDELIILNMDNGKYYGLQDTSLEIWGLIEIKKDEDDILRRLLETYENKEEIKKEFKKFISKLVNERLISYAKA